MKGEVIPGDFPPGAEADAVPTRAEGEPAAAGHVSEAGSFRRGPELHHHRDSKLSKCSYFCQCFPHLENALVAMFASRNFYLFVDPWPWCEN